MRNTSKLEKLDILQAKKIDIENRLKEYKQLARVEHWRIAKTILICTALFGIVLIAPNMGKTINYFMKNTRSRGERFRIKKSLEKLENNGFIKFIKTQKDMWGIALTKKGKEETQRLKVPYLKLPRLKKWDGKWRMVISDIPEKHKIARDALNRWLVQAGCFHLQKSTWVYPYQRWNEIRAIVSVYNVNGFVHFATVEEFNKETERELRNSFNLS